MARIQLLHAVEELERVLQRSAGLQSDIADQRKEGLALRRQIGDTVALVGSLGEGAFATQEEQTAFRREFSRMRTAMALHQASWPIVAVDANDPNYWTSVQALRDANRHFISWARGALATS